MARSRGSCRLAAEAVARGTLWCSWLQLLRTSVADFRGRGRALSGLVVKDDLTLKTPNLQPWRGLVARACRAGARPSEMGWSARLCSRRTATVRQRAWP